MTNTLTVVRLKKKKKKSQRETASVNLNSNLKNVIIPRNTRAKHLQGEQQLEPQNEQMPVRSCLIRLVTLTSRITTFTVWFSLGLCFNTEASTFVTVTAEPLIQCTYIVLSMSCAVQAYSGESGAQQFSEFGAFSFGF